MSTLLRVLPYFKDYRWFMVAGYIAVIGNAFFNLAVPRLIGIAVDDGAAKQNVSQLVMLSALIVGASALKAHRLARRGVSHAPEGRSVFSSLSVNENLVLSFRAAHGRLYR